jgi:hypothetical protein
MPRKPRRTVKLRIVEGVSEAALSYFWWNGGFKVGPGHDWAKGKTASEILEFWRKHREAILDFYIEKNRIRGGDPGRRPQVFWDELKEKRRKTGVDTWIGPVRIDGGDRTIRQSRYETDYQVLKRLGLLRGWEKEWRA